MKPVEELTPAEIEQIQEHWLRRWLAVKYPKGTQRRMDAPHIVVKKYDAKGERITVA